LITGGAGFVGSHLVDRLIGTHEVVVLDDFSTGLESNLSQHIGRDNFRLMKGTILSESDVDRALEGVTTVYHFAAQADVRLSAQRPLWDFKVNVFGSMVLLDRVREAGIKRFLFASSGGTVYGEAESFPTPESTALRPISNYGASKGAFEMYLSSYSELYGIDSVALRMGNIIGPRLTHGVIYDLYTKLKEDPSRLEVLGTGSQEKAYMYVGDAVEATALIAGKMSKGFRPVNLSSGQRLKVSTIAKAVVEELYPKAQIQYTGAERAWPGDVVLTDIDITYLKSLGWTPSMDLETVVRMYVQWLRMTYGPIIERRGK